MAQFSKIYSMLTWGQSTITSGSLLVADAAELSLSYTSTTASTISLEGSNANGATQAIPEVSWSNVSVVGSTGIFAVQPGMRWLRVRQTASTSSSSVALHKIVR